MAPYMDMELEKKTTILFPTQLYEHLARVARQRGVSVGQLVRDACVASYGTASDEARVDAARELAALDLPVASPSEMKREVLPQPKRLS